MNYLEELAKKFEETQRLMNCQAQSPTMESIGKIEQALNIQLPKDMITFAQLCKNYGSWLASLGPDYCSETHIIRINEILKKEAKIPHNFIAINVGYDDEWDCLDLETFDPHTGEYLITYWAHDVPLQEANLYGSFKDYMCACIAHWS